MYQLLEGRLEFYSQSRYGSSCSPLALAVHESTKDSTDGTSPCIIGGECSRLQLRPHAIDEPVGFDHVRVRGEVGDVDLLAPQGRP
jgi:hypothetical protein